MLNITNTINRAGSGSQGFVEVSVQLVWDTSASTIATVPTEDIVISGSMTTTSNADGVWSLDNVVENELIFPANSVYKVTETFTDGTSQSYYISAPYDEAPSYWVGDILTSKPAWA